MHPLQVFAQERVGHGKPIGERLQSNPEAKLPPLSCEGCSEAVASNVRNLVDRCGYGEPSDRPNMHEVRRVEGRDRDRAWKQERDGGREEETEWGGAGRGGAGREEEGVSKWAITTAGMGGGT